MSILVKMTKYFLFIFFIADIYSQNYILSYNQKNYEIKSEQKKNITYISLNDILDALNIKYYKNTTFSSVKFNVNQVDFGVARNNPFIKIANHTKKVVQIPVSPIMVQSDFFVPIPYFIEFWNEYLPYKMTLNENIIQIKYIEPPKIDFVKNIEIKDRANGCIIKINFSSNSQFVNHSKNKDTINLNFGNRLLVDELKEKFPESLFIKSVDKKEKVLKIIVDKNFSSYEVETNKDNLIIYIYGKNIVIQKQKLDVIVIDPGHGGKDPGAIGISGVQEKDINLAVAKKLGDLIKSNLKDVKVVYTRNDDYFVELDKRGEIANKANGKIFISIHCNSTDEKPTNLSGFEVYILRPGRSKDAIAVAEKENSVIKYEKNPERYKKLNEENFILAAMAQSSFMKYSELFAEKLHEQITNSRIISSKGVKQAGFYVLVGAAMPSVLIELGFLSNPIDEKILSSESGQNKFARQIYDAIVKFKKVYENN